jgi:tRNA-specific 2-thiouridylase
MSDPAPQESRTTGVLVGMSGGVDSSVAAMLLRQEGYRVVGVTLRLWDDPAATGERTCCSSEAVERAKAVASALSLPHVTVDAREIFNPRVVEYFVEEYSRGRTPNPCVKCNARVRFGFMLDLAHKLGLELMATGHYARMMGEPPGLARGVDRVKDQSYVLAEVEPLLLRNVLFPLGGLTKSYVRALATKAGLAGASQPESQEICFVPDDDHRRFLRSRLGERPGRIVDSQGREKGYHKGTYNYTVGQRKGLAVGGGEASYVLRLDAARSLVVVGPRCRLEVGLVRLYDVVWHRPLSGLQTTVQFRSSGGEVRGRLVEGLTVVLEEPAVGVAPGQTAVIYEGENVVAAGSILETEPWVYECASERGEKDPMV